MMKRDGFYKAFLNNTGNIQCGKVDSRSVMVWDGINPVLMSQQLLEDMDWDLPDCERLPNNTFRICQYRFEHFRTYSHYNMVAFNVVEFPSEGVPQEYWDRLEEWKAYMGDDL